jgi:aromatic ring hydroxylase
MNNTLHYVNPPVAPYELVEYREYARGKEIIENGRKKIIRYTLEQAASEFKKLQDQYEKYFKQSKEIRLANYSNFCFLMEHKTDETKEILARYLQKSNNPQFFLFEGTVTEEQIKVA